MRLGVLIGITVNLYYLLEVINLFKRGFHCIKFNKRLGVIIFRGAAVA